MPYWAWIGSVVATSSYFWSISGNVSWYRPMSRWLASMAFQLFLGWGLLSQYSPLRYFLKFLALSKHPLAMSITFIFGRCRRSSAVGAPVKYKCDSNNSRGIFAGSKVLLADKLTSFSNPTPVQMLDRMLSDNHDNHGTEPEVMHVRTC